jgi:heterodisulfide reductase subunit B
MPDFSNAWKRREARMAEHRYLMFLGCAIPYRVAAYEISARKILQKLGVELVEMPEFNCCGLPLDPVSHETMLVLAARNLAMAEQKGLDIIALCPGCAGTLKKVGKMMKQDKHLNEEINCRLKEAGLRYDGTVAAKHIMQVLIEDVGLEKIKEMVVRPLTNLKVAEHNGCHILRPKEYIGLDDPEDPKMLKTLIEATGATCLDYMDETECCGAPSVGVNDKVALQLARDKLNHIKTVDAQAMITICPFCHIMYDTNELRIEKMFNEVYGIPVLHYPQLLGLAMGMSPEELAFNELRVDCSKIIKQACEGAK